MTMRVSVLVTNYNYSAYVRAAVESALAQTLPPVEVVVVDDGSTDLSREIIETLARDYCGHVVPVMKSNGGQADAINVGFKYCSGELIAMLDADDLFDTHKLARLVQGFVDNPRAVMIQHAMRYVNADGSEAFAESTTRLPSGNLSPLLFRTGGTWMFSPTSGLAFRRTVLERILPLPKDNWRLCADGALAYAAAFLGEVHAISEKLSSYRLHGSNQHFASPKTFESLTSELVMSNKYINDWANLAGSSDRIDLERHLSYRRERFYRYGGGISEALAILRLIAGWPLYTAMERARFSFRFIGKTLTNGLLFRRRTHSGLAC